MVRDLFLGTLEKVTLQFPAIAVKSIWFRASIVSSLTVPAVGLVS